MTREERAQLTLASFRMHQRSAQRDMHSLQALYQEGDTEHPKVVWELLSWPTLALINSDSGRLLNAVAAILELADSQDAVPANTLYNAVMTALNTPGERE